MWQQHECLYNVSPTNSRCVVFKRLFYSTRSSWRLSSLPLNTKHVWYNPRLPWMEVLQQPVRKRRPGGSVVTFDHMSICKEFVCVKPPLLDGHYGRQVCDLVFWTSDLLCAFGWSSWLVKFVILMFLKLVRTRLVCCHHKSHLKVNSYSVWPLMVARSCKIPQLLHFCFLRGKDVQIPFRQETTFTERRKQLWPHLCSISSPESTDRLELHLAAFVWHAVTWAT